MPKETPQFDIDAACAHFVAHIKKNICPDFKVTIHNKGVIRNLVYYFSNQEGEYKLNKGLCLRGPFGTGKTTLMRAFASWQPNKRPFRMVNTRDIQKDCAIQGFEALFKYSKHSYNYKHGVYARENGPITYNFDDWGAEKVTKFYGTEINVMEELLQDRYNEFTETGMLTHLTTNLKDGNLIEQMYGGRVRDRLREMFNFVDLLGETHRK